MNLYFIKNKSNKSDCLLDLKIQKKIKNKPKPRLGFKIISCNAWFPMKISSFW